MEWCAFVLKAKTKPRNLSTDNGNLFTIRLARSRITRPAAQGKYSPHVRESGFRTRGNFRLWTDSGIQEILLCNLGFRNTYKAGLESELQYLESGIHGIWNPKYKTVLDSVGRKCQGCPASREWIHQTRTF